MLTISKCQEHMGLRMKSSQTLSTECLLLSGSFLVFKGFLLDFLLVNSTVSWPSFIRHCQMVVFQEKLPGEWELPCPH